jgi:hypothetical protein
MTTKSTRNPPPAGRSTVINGVRRPLVPATSPQAKRAAERVLRRHAAAIANLKDR